MVTMVTAEDYDTEGMNEHEPDCASETFEKLREFGSDEQVYKWREDMLREKTVDYHNCDEISTWFREIKHKVLRDLHDVPCVMDHMQFLSRPGNLPRHGKTPANMCPNCDR